MKVLTGLSLSALALLSLTLAASPAAAFCGFFVAKAGGDLFNESSKVVMTRKDGRTVITMANDFKGEVKDFAMVIPVPVVLKKDQIRVVDGTLIDALDAYSAPRLVEYHDRDPCALPMPSAKLFAGGKAAGGGGSRAPTPKALGVTIEAQYTVGEYDILILSAEQSSGLLTWLNQEGYNLPDGAEQTLGSYIRQGLKFFVAKVNLAEQSRLGFTNLRPLQMEYASPRFMLPIRLGTLNAKAPQDLILITVTEKGRVETTNYPVRRIPSNVDVPLFVQKEFPQFYRAMFDRQVERYGMGSVFLEYAWGQGKCDPCVGDPPNMADLKALGVWWTETPRQIFVTRLHARYTAETFPEDLVLHETGDRKVFQGRYVTRKPWTGPIACNKALTYYRNLPKRFSQEAEKLSRLTGEPVAAMRARLDRRDQGFPMEEAALKQAEEDLLREREKIDQEIDMLMSQRRLFYEEYEPYAGEFHQTKDPFRKAVLRSKLIEMENKLRHLDRLIAILKKRLD